jgi:hypothetical protein
MQTVLPAIKATDQATVALPPASKIEQAVTALLFHENFSVRPVTFGLCLGTRG